MPLILHVPAHTGFNEETNEFVDRGCERYSEFEEDVYKHLLNEIFTFDE